MIRKKIKLLILFENVLKKKKKKVEMYFSYFLKSVFSFVNKLTIQYLLIVSSVILYTYTNSFKINLSYVKFLF